MIKLLKRMSAVQTMTALLCVLIIAFQVYLDLLIPDFMSDITQLVMTPGSAVSEVWAAGGKMLLCALGSLAAAIFVGYLSAKIAAGFARDLRRSVFDKVQMFSLGEINSFSTPSLITRSTNDILQIQMIIAIGLQAMIKAPIMATWALTKIAGKGEEWTLVTALFVLLLVMVISVVFYLATPKFRRMQWLTDSVNRITRENLTGLRVIRACNAEPFQQERFSKANSALSYAHLYASRVMSALPATMNLVTSGLTLSIYWIGAVLIQSAAMGDKLGIFSNMVVFSSYAMQVIFAFIMLTIIFIMMPRVIVSAKRVNEVLDRELSVTDGPGAVSLDGKAGEVEFRNVSFKYPGAEDYVIRNVSFTARKGETVAFIGSTGSGKSTLINLIPRFYDVSEGQVLVDGVDVREYSQRQLRNRLSYIPQRSVLFTGTVSSNVAFGDNGRARPQDKEIRRAVRIAQSQDFVEAMPDQYNAAIAQGGINISGGQKQRLSIARAVCRQPEIFIFDDSFSALDLKTDKNLRGAFKAEISDATNLIVAQRIGTIRDADSIVVLEEGEIVGIGTHSSLLESCEVYREIALSQLSEEELSNE